MKKITVHQYNSVSEYFLDDKKQITEVKYLSDNRTKDYISMMRKTQYMTH